MASFLQGVKNFLFGGKKDKGDEQQQASTSSHREAGHKRSRHNGRYVHTAVLQDVPYNCHGGVQGLGWYTASLQVDADGDAAHAFLQEQHNNSSSHDSSDLQQVIGTKQANRHQCRLKGIQKGHVVIAGGS